MLYPQLVDAIADHLNRSDLYGVIPSLITLAESKMNRRLRVRQMVATTGIAIVSASEPVPADFAGSISLVINPSQDGSFPDRVHSVDIDALNESLHQMAGTPLQPTEFAVVGSNFYFSPIPDTNYNGFLTYYQRLAALSTSNTSNWMLASNADAYLYGSLAQAGIYLKEDPRVAAWQTLFEGILQEIELADRRETFGAALRPKPSLIV